MFAVRFLLVLPILLLLSCFNSARVKLEDDIFLHDNSSKVWLVQKAQIKNRNYVPINFENREIVVFHDSGNCYWNTVKDFGEKKGKKMYFSLDRETNRFELSSNYKTTIYRVKYLHRDKVILWKINKKDTLRIEMISFPEY